MSKMICLGNANVNSTMTVCISVAFFCPHGDLRPQLPHKTMCPETERITAVGLSRHCEALQRWQFPIAPLRAH